MEFLRNKPLFSFLYDNLPFCTLSFEKEEIQDENSLTTIYTLEDGLKITNILTKHDDAYEWVNWFENASDKPSKMITALYDADVNLPMPHETPFFESTYNPEYTDHTVLLTPKGSCWSFDEFTSFPDRITANRYEGFLPPNTTKNISNFGGRSSAESAPFFNIHKDNKGYIFAIGWSGQWNCEVTRNQDDVTIKAKIEDTEFYLLPNEKIRTSSFVVMPYSGSITESQNKWRRLLKKHFSPIGKDGRDALPPLCAMIWGGMKTQAAIERVNAIKEAGLTFDYIWMDAGWYGKDTEPSADEWDCTWGKPIGDWQPAPLIHPDGLKPFSDTVHKAGMKFLLWIEPERAVEGSPITTEHPEYFIHHPNTNWLLNLGKEEAWDWAFNTICTIISENGIDCYREDLNFYPLDYWRSYDGENRKGITEIKHIMGHYRLWDALLEKFPHLLIDNCASGGRRIDIENYRRSVPLWRSDYTCTANYIPEAAQCHNLSFNSWLPYSGTGTGRITDTYNIRSSFGASLAAGYFFSGNESFEKDCDKLEWLKKMLQEYKLIQPYFSEDFYPLSQISDRTDIWCASQFNRPEQKDGMVMVFRRENSPYETASYHLNGLDNQGSYIFTDIDTGENTEIDAKELSTNGLPITMKKKRTAKIYVYKKA